MIVQLADSTKANFAANASIRAYGHLKKKL